MHQRASSEVGATIRRVQGKKLAEGVNCGVRGLTNDWEY